MLRRFTPKYCLKGLKDIFDLIQSQDFMVKYPEIPKIVDPNLIFLRSCFFAEVILPVKRLASKKKNSTFCDCKWRKITQTTHVQTIRTICHLSCQSYWHSCQKALYSRPRQCRIFCRCDSKHLIISLL